MFASIFNWVCQLNVECSHPSSPTCSSLLVLCDPSHSQLSKLLGRLSWRQLIPHTISKTGLTSWSTSKCFNQHQCLVFFSNLHSTTSNEVEEWRPDIGTYISIFYSWLLSVFKDLSKREKSVWLRRRPGLNSRDLTSIYFIFDLCTNFCTFYSFIVHSSITYGDWEKIPNQHEQQEKYNNTISFETFFAHFCYELFSVITGAKSLLPHLPLPDILPVSPLRAQSHSKCRGQTANNRQLRPINCGCPQTSWSLFTRPVNINEVCRWLLSRSDNVFFFIIICIAYFP